MRKKQNPMPTMGLQVLGFNLKKREKQHTEDESRLEDVRDGVVEIILAVLWNDSSKNIIK